MPVNESIKKAAAEALAAINQYGREKFTHGTDRIRLYYSDVDGDWLDEFQASNSESLNLVQECNFDPAIVANYLISNRWREDEVVENHYSIWKLCVANVEYSILLPFDPEIPDFLNRMYEVIRVLSSVENRPENEFLNDLVSAVQIAKERGREILNIHLYFPQEEVKLEAPARKISNIISTLQDTLDAIGKFETQASNAIQKISKNITNQTNLDMIGVFNGSFGIRLALTSPTDDERNSWQSDTPFSELIMDDLINLLSSSSHEKIFRELMLKFHHQSADYYRNFLIALADSQASLRIEWGSPNQSKGGYADLSHFDALRAIKICNETIDTTLNVRNVIGRFFAVDTKRKTFKMKDIHDEEVYAGKISADVLMGDIEIVVKPPTTYRAVIQEKITKAATGKIKKEHTLSSLESWVNPNPSLQKVSQEKMPEM